MAGEEVFDLDTGEVKVIHEDPPKKPPQHPNNNNNNDSRQRRIIIDGRTILRRRLTPYLPPPVVKAIGDIDPFLEPYVGPEASITIATSLLLSFLVLQLIKAVAGGGLGAGGKAIADDDDDNPALTALNQMSAEDFGDTVILCGPMWSGKTRIFHHLCHGDANLPTVMSLRANAAILPLNDDDDDNNNNNKPLRVMDYPGHSGLQDSLFVEMIQAKPIRFVLVVDSTQPLAPAADFLYDLVQHAKDMDTTFDVFVACHKCDLSSSKNPRRIKISLRTELEKLIKVRSTKAASAAAEQEEEITTTTTQKNWWTEGESLDMDELKHARLRFEATTCNVGDGIDKLAEFCKTGAME